MDIYAEHSRMVDELSRLRAENAELKLRLGAARNSDQKCVFYDADSQTCGALIECRCDGCKFYKTSDRYFKDMTEAETLLFSKGLEAVTIRNAEGVKIRTVRQI